MASFLFALLRGFVGQDGMINQPLTDVLNSLLGAKQDNNSNTSEFCWIQSDKTVIAVVHLYCTIKISPGSQTAAAGMTSYSYFSEKQFFPSSI